MDGAIEFDREVVMGYPSKEEMATDSAAGRRFIEIGGIAMDVEDHVRSTEANGGIGVSGTVVKEVCNQKVGVVGGPCLLLSPWAKAPISLPKAVIQVSRKIGSLMSSSYLVMDLPVVG